MFLGNCKNLICALGLSGIISGEVFYFTYMSDKGSNLNPNLKNKDVKVVFVKKTEKTKEFHPIQITFKDNIDGKNKTVIFDSLEETEDDNWYLDEDQNIGGYQIKKWQKTDETICKYRISDDKKLPSISISDRDQLVLNEFLTRITLESPNCEGISIKED